MSLTASTNLPKNDQNQHLFGFSDRDKNFLENIDYRNKTLKSSSFGYEIAENISILAQKHVVLVIWLKNHDSRYTNYDPVENANPIIVVTYDIKFRQLSQLSVSRTLI